MVAAVGLREEPSHTEKQRKMATGFNLPPPSALEIHDINVAEKWKNFVWPGITTR